MGQAYLLLVLIAVVVTFVLWQPTAADSHSVQHKHMHSPHHGEGLPQDVLDQIGDAIKGIWRSESLRGDYNYCDITMIQCLMDCLIILLLYM